MSIIREFFDRVFGGGENAYDMGQIQLCQYNRYAGAQKNLTVGPWLAGIAYENAGSILYTTDVSTQKTVEAGSQLAVYNNNAAVQILRIDKNTITALGSVGDVGETFSVIPCPPGEWTLISMGQWTYVRSGSSDLLTYLVLDDTKMRSKQV